MKKLFALFLVIITLSGVHAQTKDRNMLKQGEIFKVPLLEKFNLPARKLPQLLIKAYCEGLIQGYYPLQVDSPCSYHMFMKHFGFGKTQPKTTADEFTDITCPQSFCEYSDDPTLDNFKSSFELIENKRFDKNLSTEVYDIKYVRLIYVFQKGDISTDFYGPVFRYDDVIALTREDFRLPNPKNAAADLTFKQFFTQRMYHGYIIKNSLLKSNDPDPNKNKEKDVWQY